MGDGNEKLKGKDVSIVVLTAGLEPAATTTREGEREGTTEKKGRYNKRDRGTKTKYSRRGLNPRRQRREREREGTTEKKGRCDKGID